MVHVDRRGPRACRLHIIALTAYVPIVETALGGLPSKRQPLSLQDSGWTLKHLFIANILVYADFQRLPITICLRVGLATDNIDWRMNDTVAWQTPAPALYYARA